MFNFFLKKSVKCPSLDDSIMHLSNLKDLSEDEQKETTKLLNALKINQSNNNHGNMEYNTTIHGPSYINDDDGSTLWYDVNMEKLAKKWNICHDYRTEDQQAGSYREIIYENRNYKYTFIFQ